MPYGYRWPSFITTLGIWIHLTDLTRENLIEYLPEEEWEQYENDYQCQNCGGGFMRDVMVFGDDVDLCKDCAK